MTTNSAMCLPTLDGTAEASVARLDAWLHRYDGDTVEDGLYAVREHVEEAQLALAEVVGKTKSDVAVLDEAKAELGKALSTLRDVELATFDLQVVAS